jgi:hypothetical protein
VQRHYRALLPQIKALMLPILRMRGLRLPAKTLCIAGLDLFVEHDISFVYAFAVYMQAHSTTEVYRS